VLLRDFVVKKNVVRDLLDLWENSLIAQNFLRCYNMSIVETRKTSANQKRLSSFCVLKNNSDACRLMPDASKNIGKINYAGNCAVCGCSL
jgi:hypothetical protein